MEFLNNINNLVTVLNYYLWSYILVTILLIIGIYFSFKLKLSQITMLFHALSLVTKRDKGKKARHHISSFQAFSISMASVVGVGSIAGVAIAISLGGPGAIFWMWIISFVAMSTSLIEHTLGQIYKERYVLDDKNSIFVGGPSYYILKGLKNKFLAYLFSIIIVITYGIVFNSVQSNTISISLDHAFNIPKALTGIVVTILSACIILGGIKRIAKISSFIVPCMGLCYLIIIILIIIINIKEVPSIFVLIFKSAFGIEQAVSGSASYIFMQVLLVGIKRAMFSTEAGLGSTPNITASAFVKHPVRQGLVGMLGVFFVAFIICTGTALIILTNDVYITNNQVHGIALTQEALKNSLGGFSVYILAISIFIFGFTSIIGNYSYAEHNLSFIYPQNTCLLYLLRIALVLTVFLGSIASLYFVWNLADFFMAIMILINLWALCKLSSVAISVIFNYKKQLKYTHEPIFTKSSNIYLKNEKDNIW